MTSSIHVAVGPELPDFGSWQWLGQGIVEGLKPPFTVEKFADPEKPPAADIVVYIKFLPPANRLVEIAREARIVYLPVDVHGTCNEIDECFESTRSLSLVLVNCMRLLRYYRGYCPVEYVDHPLKFALASPRLTTEDGPWIWIGRQCNIAPIVQWANSFSLRRDLWVLTNFEGDCSSANSLGFRSENVKVERWCEQKHMHYLNVASVAVDIKGTDFRARHKPPAKALDFLASGIPLITNRGSSADLHLGTLGFRPIYDDSWQLELGDEHRKSTMEFGAKLQSTLSRRSVLGHPALHERTLADQLRTTFLRRLRGRLKRGELVWPAEEIGMSQEAFFEGMSRKPWIASSQSPTIQTGDDAGQAADGAQGIVHYLAAYVSGTAIGNGRIIDDDGQMVRFQFKDYRTGKVGIEKLTGVEFTRRFCQHVWPKSIRKVRYGGLFAARGRVERMVRCNELISQSVAATTGVAQDNQASTDSKFSGDLDTSGDIEEAPTMTGCRCRYCQGPLAVTCRLKGLPTQRLMSLVAAITGLLPALSEQVIATLKTNLPCTPRELNRIRRQCLPRTVADVMSGMTLDYEHSHALFAFIDWAQESWRTASMLPFKPP